MKTNLIMFLFYNSLMENINCRNAVVLIDVSLFIFYLHAVTEFNFLTFYTKMPHGNLIQHLIHLFITILMMVISAFFVYVVIILFRTKLVQDTTKHKIWFDKIILTKSLNNF